MTIIHADSLFVTPAAELPDDWAKRLGHKLCDKLEDEACVLLQDRIVGLGHGVQLAHIRTPHVHEPTLGAWKAADADPEEKKVWLWIIVLVPSGDPSRHLGWMAHLAAGLHEESRRGQVRAAGDRDQLREALNHMLAPRTAVYKKPATINIQTTSGNSADWRMVIAILKEVEFVDHLLQLFIEHEVRGATVLEARGMAEHLSAHMSLFAGFKSAFKAVGHSQVIMTLVPAERTEEVLELVRESAGGMRTPGSGIAFALDVPAVVGLNKIQDGGE